MTDNQIIRFMVKENGQLRAGTESDYIKQMAQLFWTQYKARVIRWDQLESLLNKHEHKDDLWRYLNEMRK
jgi:hypothetical protein